MVEYKFRPGIQAIVYRNINGKREFLVMHRIKNWVGWELPKGGLKKGEDHQQALLRELSEECGITGRDINRVWPTDTNIRINYPKESWEKAGFRGAFYKNFLVELNPSAKLTLEKNDEPEHDGTKWISVGEIAEHLADPKLQRSVNDSSKALESYLAVERYAQEIKGKTGERFVGFMLYGSRIRGQNTNESDYDIALVLTKPENGDITLLNGCKAGGLKCDFQLFYMDELPKDGNFLSQDSTGAYAYFTLRNAIPLLGSNPLELIKEPDKNVLELSILAKTQYYIYRLRQLLLGQSKNNTNLLYFTKRLAMVLRMITMLKGSDYTDVDDALDRFGSIFPGTFTEQELEKLKSALNNNEPLDPDALYDFYMKAYHACLDYSRQNSSLVTLNEVPVDRKI